jgi:hypothetical protein
LIETKSIVLAGDCTTFPNCFAKHICSRVHRINGQFGELLNTELDSNGRENCFVAHHFCAIMFASVLREFAPVFIDVPVQQSLEILTDSVRTLKKTERCQR